MTKKEMWEKYKSEFHFLKECDHCYKKNNIFMVFKCYFDDLEVCEIYGESLVRRNCSIYICEKCFIEE